MKYLFAYYLACIAFVYIKVTKEETLDLASCEIDKLFKHENGDFSFLSEEKYIKTISANDLQRYTHVFMENNKIQKLEDYAFSSFTNMKELELSNNPLQVLSENAFNGIPKLQYLTINSTLLEFLHSTLFSNLPNLYVLMLSHNQISYLDIHLFEKNTLLNSISLDYNQIRQISGHLFSNLKELQILRLNNNHITTLSSDMIEFISIFTSRKDSYLDITKNGLKVTTDLINAFKRTTPDCCRIIHYSYGNNLELIQKEFSKQNKAETSLFLNKKLENAEEDFVDQLLKELVDKVELQPFIKLNLVNLLGRNSDEFISFIQGLYDINNVSLKTPIKDQVEAFLKNQEIEEQCAICLDKLIEKDATLLQCEHGFHSDCITSSNQKKCPICRKDFK